MKFADFLKESISEAKKTYDDLHKDVVYVGGKYKAGDVYAMDDDSIEFESHTNIKFNLYPVLEKGEDDALNEVLFIEVDADYDVDYHHQRGTYNDPEITEFDLNTKHAKYSFDIYVDKHADEETYPGLAAATERLKEAYKDKDKLKKAAKDALSDIFEAYEDHIFKLFKDDSEDRYWNSKIDSHDDY